MTSKTIVITGAGSGLGLVAARHPAQAGMDLVLVGREKGRTEAAAKALNARPLTADLGRRTQVRELAARLGTGIDVLINNAGAAFPRYEASPDGAERTYAVNHHAPFLLSHALLEAGALAPDARIVNLSSFVEKRGRLDVTDPDVLGTSWRDRFYSQIHVYATSKLLSLLAAMELARRLPHGMRVYNADPGMVKGTGFNANVGGLMRLTAPLFRPFSITPDEGVRTVVWLAMAVPAPEPSGGFFTGSAPVEPSRPARDQALARTVYERTASLLGVAPLPPA
jgi:NAD(P)-dependent dehydrogenase (short-subunit alcohol dehydrogenase family)